jgi:hypothetical protein
MQNPANPVAIIDIIDIDKTQKALCSACIQGLTSFLSQQL